MPYFFRKLGKMLKNLSSATVVIGALRVKKYSYSVPSSLASSVVGGMQYSGSTRTQRPMRSLHPRDQRRHEQVYLYKSLLSFKINTCIFLFS